MFHKQIHQDLNIELHSAFISMITLAIDDHLDLNVSNITLLEILTKVSEYSILSINSYDQSSAKLSPIARVLHGMIKAVQSYHL